MSATKVRICPEPNCWAAFSALTLKCPQCGTPYRTPMQRLKDENAALKARIAELEEELGGWVKSFDDVNARCIALSERYES